MISKTKLAAEREKRGWSQSELGRRCGVNQVTISQIETRRLLPYPKQLAKLAQALEFSEDPSRLMDEFDWNDIPGRERDSTAGGAV